MRIPMYLTEHRVSFETIIHPPAFTAQQRAKFLRLPGRQVAKAVLLSGPRGHFLAVLPATHQLDINLLSETMGGSVGLAPCWEITELFRDCEWGVVAAFGTLYGLPVVLDVSLKPDDSLILAGHTHAQAIRIRCRDYERLERPRRMKVCSRNQPAQILVD
jgi:Ala-tRNA(Pro) deacylase